MSIELTNEKKIIYIHLFLFFVSIPCVIFINPALLALTGCNIGFIIGVLLKRNSNLNFTIHNYITFFIIAGISIISSLLLFKYLGNSSILLVIIVNFISMLFLILYVVRVIKNNNNS